ncbi:MAG: hypothetical protein R3B45_04770 [Bdellovibrionota bacterium]
MKENLVRIDLMSSICVIASIFFVLDRWLLTSFVLLIISCDAPTPKGNEGSSAIEKEVNSSSEDSGFDEESGDLEESMVKTPQQIKAESEAFFEKFILLAMQESCSTCHAEPRFNPNPEAPLSIFGFEAMREKLLDGDDPINNAFLDKVRNVSMDHTGGNRCSSDLKAEPCSLFIAWGKIEYQIEPIYPGDVPLQALELSNVTALGDVYGYAAYSKNSSEKLEVRFYIGGDENTGSRLATVIADDPGFSGGIPGGHLFKYKVPDQYRDGLAKKLSAFTTINGESIELENSPFAFTSWLGKGADAFYNANVGDAFQQCEKCHTNRGYNDFSKLIEPSPAIDGSPTNNILYMRAHNKGHSGASCNSTCEKFIKDWWMDEFGGS